MAKELGIKIKVDGVETVLKSFNDVEDRISSLKKQLANAEVGGKAFKDLQKELKATEAAYTSAQIKNQSFLDSLSKAPGIMGTLGQSIKGVGQGFQALAANPFVAVAGVLAMIIQKVIEKMSTMEGITDSLGKVMGAFGGIVGNIVNAVITPLAEGIAYVIEGMASLMSAFSDNAANGAEFADALDTATEAEKENAIAVAEANAQLAEARERAADVTLSTQERVKALKDAAAIEKKTTEDSIKINTQKLAAQLGTIATEIGARKELIDQIKSGSLEEIKAARASLLTQKNVDKEKIYALDAMIIEIENSKRKSSNIERKTNKEIAAIENQAQKDKEAAAKDAETKRLERIKKANAEKIKELDAAIANEIASENTRDKELKTLLDARMKFDLEGVKKGSELEAKIKREYAEKATQALDADLKKRSDDTVKAIAELNKETAKQEQKGITQNQEIRDEELNQIQLALSRREITEEQARQKSFEAAKKQGEADLKLLQDNQKAQLDELEKNKSKLTNEAYLAEKEKITEKYETRIANQTKTNNKLVLDNTLATNKEIAASNKKLQEDRLALLDQEFNNELTSYDRRIAIIREKQAVMLADATLTADARRKIEIDSQNAEIEAFIANRQRYIDATNQAAGAVGELAAAFGEESEAGAALLKVQEALNIATQIANFVTQIQVLAKKASAQATQQDTTATSVNTLATTGNTATVAANTVTTAGGAIVDTAAGAAKGVKGAAAVPFPGSIPAIISIIATFVGIFASIKSMLSKKKEAETEAGGAAAAAAKPTGSMFAKGGLLVGPSHAEGGIKSPYGELEGGEFVVNKRSTQSFMPLLESINAVGNRKYANGGGIPSVSDLQEMLTNQPQPIVKTYVVSSDMSSAMEADKKISDLAKL